VKLARRKTTPLAKGDAERILAAAAKVAAARRR